MRRRVINKREDQGLIGNFVYGKGLNNQGGLVSYSDRIITPYIPIPSNCKKINFYGAFVSEAVDPNNHIIDACLIEYNSSRQMSSSDSYWTNDDHIGGRTVDIYKLGITKYVRFTIKQSRLQYAYLKDVTNNQVLFNGKDFV